MVSEDPAIKSLQAFFLSRYDKMQSCKHEPTFASPPGEPEFIHEYCYCGKIDKIHLSPKLAADLMSNSSIREATFRAKFEDGNFTELYGLPVVISDPK